MSNATLRIFNAIPEDPSSDPNDFRFFSAYGVLVTGNALHEEDKIKFYFEKEELSGRQLNSSFHKSWKRVAEASDDQLLIEQIIHYLSTYGLASIDGYRDDTVFIPAEELDVPKAVPLKVIRGLPKTTLISRSFAMLQSGRALEQETIEDLLAVLEECQYEFTGREQIANKEAQAIIADKTGVTPEGEDFLRYCLYKATWSTLIVKNETTFRAIRESGFELPVDCWKSVVTLAESFNRHKSIWLAFKKVHPDNASFVNRLAKLSKKHHKPMPEDVLGNLTNADYSREAVQKAADKANTARIVRALNAVRFYQADSENRFYAIRNGKGWAQKKPLGKKQHSHLGKYEEVLREVLQKRTAVNSIYQPDCVDYAVPTSQKQYLGNVPAGTAIQITKGKEHFLVGIYWEGSQVDLDLRADSIDGSIGWNADYRAGDRSLMHSGDVTSAPDGATEWLYATEIDTVYLVKANLFSGLSKQPFQVVVGYGNDISQNYVIDPSKVLFSAKAEMVQWEITLGVLEPTEDGAVFYLCGQGSGERQVGGNAGISAIVRQSLINSYRSKIRLSELVPVKEDSTIDLSPGKLEADSISSTIF